ncbi:MAG: hypothetical protein OET44_15575 [Gammaproteobacteria bacterium]|nr:hypothetical protein [Gammaproteobacteria bacterium]
MAMHTGQDRITRTAAVTGSLEPQFKPLRVIVPTLALLLAVSLWIQWYSREVSMPRYCDDPAGALVLLERVLTEARPAGSDKRRPYLVAAKLIFLVPRESDEVLEHYLARVRRHLAEICR